MIAWILAGLFLGVIVFAVGISMRESPKQAAFRKYGIQGVQVFSPTPESQEMVPSELKAEVASMEKEVFEKADQVCEIVDRETGRIAHPAPVPEMEPEVDAPRDPLTETALLKAVSVKVEQVKRLSGGANARS